LHRGLKFHPSFSHAVDFLEWKSVVTNLGESPPLLWVKKEKTKKKEGRKAGKASKPPLPPLPPLSSRSKSITGVEEMNLGPSGYKACKTGGLARQRAKR